VTVRIDRGFTAEEVAKKEQIKGIMSLESGGPSHKRKEFIRTRKRSKKWKNRQKLRFYWGRVRKPTERMKG